MNIKNLTGAVLIVMYGTPGTAIAVNNSMPQSINGLVVDGVKYNVTILYGIHPELYKQTKLNPFLYNARRDPLLASQAITNYLNKHNINGRHYSGGLSTTYFDYVLIPYQVPLIPGKKHTVISTVSNYSSCNLFSHCWITRSADYQFDYNHPKPYRDAQRIYFAKFEEAK